MSLLPIRLDAREGNWRIYTARKASKAFQAMALKVMERDDHSCRFCGHKDNRFMDVVNIDANYAHNTAENLATACSLCAQCFFLDSLGLDGKTGGRIALIPEISQADINNFVRVLFCALEKESPYKGRLQSVYLSFIERCKEVEDTFGPGTSQAPGFGQGMIDGFLTPEQHEHQVLDDLRLIPIRRPFRNQIEHWADTVNPMLPL